MTKSEVKPEINHQRFSFHRMTIQEICQKFSTSSEIGLTDLQLKLNSALGANKLSPINKKSECLKFIAQLFRGFSILLWIGSALLILVYEIQIIVFHDNPPPDNLWLAGIMILVTFLNGTIAYFQEAKINDTIKSFGKLSPHHATVIRNGKLERILASEIVLGDLVTVQAGDRIPADLRLSKCWNFKVDNSILTGESKPQIRTTECTTDDYVNSTSIAFFSTFAVQGNAEGIAVAVGDETQVGQMGRESCQVKVRSSPLADEINDFLWLISCLAILCGVISAVLTISMGYTWSDSILFLVALTLSNIPLGLVYFITIFLVIVARKLGSHNCRVKSLYAVETLGSTSVICSDKTGTLTRNLLSVSRFWTPKDLDLEGELKENTGAQGGYNDCDGFSRIANVSILCNNAIHLDHRGSENGNEYSKSWCGNSTDEALLRYFDSCSSVLSQIQVIRMSHKKLFELPFNSTSKFHLVLCQKMTQLGNSNSKYLIVMKGAPETLLHFCNKIMINNNQRPLTSDWNLKIESTVQELAASGERIIALCDLEFEIPVEINEAEPSSAAFLNDLNPNNPDSIYNLIISKGGLCFIGLISLHDPIRDGAQEFVSKCRMAGIKVVMITGDHNATATSIAKTIGIFYNHPLVKTAEDVNGLDIIESAVSHQNLKQIAVNGLELTNMSDASLRELLLTHEEIIFTRMSPSQKLLVVEAFQSLGEIVAVLGDGVNDCLAMKKADIGIAVGENCSEISKELAEMVLTDGNISSIILAVQMGRLMFENLKQCCFYSITDSMPFILPFLSFILLKIPLPVGAVSLIVIALATDMFPAISLVYEKPDSELLKEGPRNPKKSSLVTSKLVSYSYGQIGMLEACSGMLIYLVIMAQNGFRPQKLFGIRDSWDSKSINDLEDSYGQEWTHNDRKRLESTAQSGFFISIVMTQWATLIISKAHRRSIFTSGMRNWRLNLALAWETMLIIFFIYTPGMDVLGFLPLKWNWWLVPLPYILAIVFYNELRLWIMKRFKGCWLEQEFQY